VPEIGLTEVQGRWEVPQGWHWDPLSSVTMTGIPELGHTQAQRDHISDEGTVPLIQSEDVKNIKEIIIRNKITQKAVKDYDIKLFTGRKLLVTVARQTMGRVGILNTEEPTAINNAVSIITPNEDVILLDFLYYYFLMERTRAYLKIEIVPDQSYASTTRMGQVQVVVAPMRDQRRILQRIRALLQDIKRCHDLLDTIQVDTLSVINKAITDTFTARRINEWPNRETLQALLGNDSALPSNLPLLTYEHYSRWNNLLSRVTLKDDRILPRFLLWSLLARAITVNGTRLGERNVTRSNLLKAMLLFPDKNEQKHIVNHLAALQDTMHKIQQQQQQDLQRLEQLEQIILEKAFRGKL
jgi:restriction endonuclease S subunit